MDVVEQAGATLRWLRAALLAGVWLATGAAAHVAAQGALPGLSGLAALYVIGLLAAALALGRPATTRRLLVLTVVGQSLVHGILTALSGHRGDPPLVRAATPPLPAPVQHLLADLTGPHALMALAHLVAAALLGLWLARGERALWSLLRLARDTARVLTARRVRRLVPAVPTLPDRLRQAGTSPLPPRPGQVLARAVNRRGPPLPVAG